jgi:C-terminal processing protease CtpA/Prc
MGLIIQRIEPNGRVARDGTMRIGDRIVEINNNSLIDIDFKTAQKLLRDAINQSNDPNENIDLEFKLVRSMNTLNNNEEEEHNEYQYQYQEENEEEEEDINERPIEIELNTNNIHINNNEQYNEDENNKENNTVINNNNNNDSSSFNNHLSSINMSALNTKKMGKIITVQLVKGPQGLGFKLAARDNCASGEYSPIYIKNILPKGAAITDGRLQRGDRLIEVDKMDMTKTTLHEAVNILRNTKLGACVELVVSRQILPSSNTTTTTTITTTNEQIQSPIKTSLPREIQNDEADSISVTNTNTNTNQRRQLLTFEIALNDTGSAGLGVSVKGKTKRMEENDCSVDLGIFIKIVIHGGAAFKDGRLKANDQLININGFSLLGKSNEEAMLILREAMQVESKPGHIQLTVSRKCKSNQFIPNEQQQQQQQKRSVSPIIEKPVVKIINHSTQSPMKQQAIINKNLNSTPVTTITSSISNTQNRTRKEENNNNRFSRDAPSRRSMSEKRTKIGSSLPINKSQTVSNGMSNTISNNNNNNGFQRGTCNQSSLIDTNNYVSSQPKRSSHHHINVTSSTSNMFKTQHSNKTNDSNDFRTLNKNFKIKTQLNQQFKPHDLNTIVSQESLLASKSKPSIDSSSSAAVVLVKQQQQQQQPTNNFGSFESVVSQTVTLSSSKLKNFIFTYYFKRCKVICKN